ncbi:site-specific integrase [Lysinibacillus sp. BW-2-10]|uniref:site-specific integrase n=1 Tax=Lysinibacillus sp. BW-2-10 TaxID=2590030 RepID=UPI00117F4F86|nr:site-specific integrase [Lysinibacillus sp. BW-2-10]TSI06675.1 site-specific integrase [Lysinibacillus sp. BW-2-10]
MFCKPINKTTWLCIADGPRDPVTGKRRQVSRRGKSKGEAKKRVEAAIKELENATCFDSKIKFKEFSGQWLQQYRLKGNKETTNEHREYCISLLNKYIANRKMTEITTLDLQNTFNHLFESGTAQSTLSGTRNVVKMICSYAKDVGLIEVNPVEAVFIPKKQLSVEEINGSKVQELFLETTELKEFLGYVDKYRNVVYRTLIYLLAFTGMRPGEAVSLKLNDIDIEQKKIRITKTTYAKTSKKGDFTLTPPKTHGSIRTVDIDDIVVEKILYLLKYKQDKDWKHSEFLFGDKEGIPPIVKLLNQTVKRIGQKTSITKKFQTYILRHTHISLLAEAGVDLNIIMDRVGHKNSKTTTEIYLHVTSGMKQQAAEKMHAKFTELLK